MTVGDMKGKKLELRIFLDSINRLKRFDRVVNQPFYENYDIDIYITPNRSFDAKSFLAICGLDTTNCVYVYINTYDRQVLDRFESDMKEFKYKIGDNK